MTNESNWKNPAENPANDTVDFTRQKYVYLAEKYNTVIDADYNLEYLKAHCARRNGEGVTFWKLNRVSGTKVQV